MLNYHEATLTMIDYEGNKYRPKEPEQPKPTDSKEALEWLEANAGFRPFGAEW